MPLARGDVIAMRRCGVGLVFTANSQHVWVSPVGGCNGPPTHRAEVRITETDAAAMGIDIKYPVVRCQQMVKISIQQLADNSRIGSTPPHVMNQVIRSAVMEARRQAEETNMDFRLRSHAAPSVVF